MNLSVDPTASAEQQRRYFEEQLRYDHEADRIGSNTLAVHQIQHGMIREAVRSEAARGPVHFLDIGCGWGDFSNQLDPWITDYIGVEPSASELSQFTKRPRRSLIHGVGENLSLLRPRSRNVILLNSVLDHCLDWRKTFDNCLRVLSPGGLLIISMENSEKLPVVVKKALHFKANHKGHLAFFHYTSFGKFLRDQGFAIERHCTTGYLYGFNAVTLMLPVPVGIMRAVNRGVDAIGRCVYPRGGHIFFFAARDQRPRQGPEQWDQPFQCPKCAQGWLFGTKCCSNCGQAMEYGADGALEAMGFAGIDQIINGTATAPT